MYLLGVIKCCHRKLLVTGIVIWSCASLSVYFSMSTSVSSFGVVANTNQVLFRRVQGWISTEWALRLCSKPLPMVVIVSCVTVHDVSSHLRLLCVKYKPRKEQNQNWLPLIFATDVDPLTWAQRYARSQLPMTNLLKMWFGHPSDAASSGAFLPAVTKQNVIFLRESECAHNHMGKKKKPSGAFSWSTSHVCIQAEILPPPWPMVTLCVGEELTTVNAPLQAAQQCFSPFSVGRRRQAEVGLEGSQAMARGHLALQRRWCSLECLWTSAAPLVHQVLCHVREGSLLQTSPSRLSTWLEQNKQVYVTGF